MITHGLIQPHGIAVDWVGEQLYWTDMGTRLIEVSSMNGSYRLPLISTGLQKPRAIVLYPSKGLMFWTDWGDIAMIERSYMDGSSRKTLLSNKTKLLFWPNGLTIDNDTNLLYWIDGKLNVVGYMGLNGENPGLLLDASNPYQNGYSLTIFGEYIYASFSRSKNVIRLDKASGSNKRVYFSSRDTARGTAVLAYDKSKQVKTGACKKHDCEQICLPYGEKQYRYVHNVIFIK